jgi:L,D-transpeptidase catalytic domain
MRIFTNLLFKVTLSSMILTAPAMINGSKDDAGYGTFGKEVTMPYYSSAVIEKFVGHSALTSKPMYLEDGERSEKRAFSEAKTAEVKMVINEAVIIYGTMSLEKDGLDEKAFEYAWRGYHNLLKKGRIRKKSVLSICDFSQSSCSKRMYVIDVRRHKLLYRTYVAHGQNSGAEYATSFSNEPDSYKSSLGFYITKKTYVGRNGLSLRIDGVDSGYNDMAGKRNIVLHGSSYATAKYMENYGSLGTSLGCPAIPYTMSPRIIRTVKNGSCLFIYHPTTTYLENSTIINGNG